MKQLCPPRNHLLQISEMSYDGLEHSCWHLPSFLRNSHGETPWSAARTTGALLRSMYRLVQYSRWPMFDLPPNQSRCFPAHGYRASVPKTWRSMWTWGMLGREAWKIPWQGGLTPWRLGKGSKRSFCSPAFPRAGGSFFFTLSIA